MGLSQRMVAPTSLEPRTLESSCFSVVELNRLISLFSGNKRGIWAFGQCLLLLFTLRHNGSLSPSWFFGALQLLKEVSSSSYGSSECVLKKNYPESVVTNLQQKSENEKKKMKKKKTKVFNATRYNFYNTTVLANNSIIPQRPQRRHSHSDYSDTVIRNQ